MFLLRFIFTEDEQPYWDPDLEPTKEMLLGYFTELFPESAEEAIEEIVHSGYTPPTLDELEKLQPGEVLRKNFYRDRGEGDWGAIPEGYIIKRLAERSRR